MCKAHRKVCARDGYLKRVRFRLLIFTHHCRIVLQQQRQRVSLSDSLHFQLHCSPLFSNAPLEKAST